MKTAVAFLVGASLASVGCSKKDGEEAKKDEPAAKTTESGKTAEAPKPTTPPPAEDGKKVFKYDSATAFYEDYNSVKGAAWMDKFTMEPYFEIKGKVTKVIEEANGSKKLWFGVTDKTWVSLSFKDGTSIAEAKVDDELSVGCKAGGATDNYIMLLDCEKK